MRWKPPRSSLRGLITLVAVLAAILPAQPDDPETERLTQEFERLVREGHYAEAATAAREFVERARAAGRFETTPVARAMRALVEASYRSGRAKNAETRDLARESVDLSRRLFGDSHPDYASSLSNLAKVLLDNEDFAGARIAYNQTLVIREKVFGPRSLEVALSLNNLASVEGIAGNFAPCRSFLERALSIQEEKLGADSLPVAHIRHNYALFLQVTGDLLGAQEEGERAFSIRDKLLPPDHPLTAMTLHNLAGVKARLGDFVSARDMNEKALAMQERSLGPDHPDVARTLANLAGMLADAGRFAEARALHERALPAMAKSLGEDHSFLAEGRSEFGLLLARMGDLEGAKRVLLLALRGQEAALGPAHHDIGMTLNRLGRVEAESGDVEAALQHFRRALEIYDKAYDPTHPLIAQSLLGLGELRLAAGDFDGAEALFRRALTIQENALGAEHPDVAVARLGLARVSWGRGRAREALGEALRAEDLLRAHFHRVLPGLSEREALAYEKVRASGLGMALSALASAPPGDLDPASVERVWSALGRSRALVLDHVASRHRLLSAHESPEAKALARGLAAATNRLASLVVRGPDPERPLDYRRSLAEAVSEKERLEREIAETSGDLQAGRKMPPTSLSALKGALPAGGALLAYVEYARLGPLAPGGPPALAPAKDPGRAYAALVLRSDQRDPRFFDLGSAGRIDSLIGDWMERAVQPGAARPAGAAAEKEYRDTGTSVRRSIWDPLEKSLAGMDKIFIVPDGSINLVNFAALPIGERRYLIDRRALLHYLSAERDLLRDRGRPARHAGLFVMGGPDFDATPEAAARPSGDPPDARTSPVYRGPTAECADFQSLHFDPLPGSLQEASEIESLGDREGAGPGGNDRETIRLTGSAASEAAFKRMAMQGGRLHLATHGFFLGSGCGGGSPGSGRDTRFGSSQVDENPLLLSGIALAGANQRARAAPGAEDGILTAEEIASLDLVDVDWAVLSGCETALGTIRSGEGVFGLRRAFEVAGVDTLIMSLWKVEDRSTLAWMRKLYESRASGSSAAEAVRDASRTVLESRRAAGKSTHPFYWGAFVAAGEWR